MSITMSDEEAHTPTGESAWQESFYFNWADLDGQAFGLTRIGLNPADGKADGLLITVRDGRLEYVYPAIGVRVDDAERTTPARRGVRVGALGYTMREPLTRWHIDLTGHTQVDLSFTALGPPHDYSPAGGDTNDAAPSGAHHFEQFGAVTGHITVNGREHRVDAFGQRDKSWGVREWGAIRGWEWLTGHFGPDLAFNVTLSLVPGQDGPSGFLFRDGENIAVTDASVDYTWGRTPHVPTAADIRLCDERGDVHHIHATALAQVPLVKKGLFLQETHARFDMQIDGVTRTGAGVLEHAWHADAGATLRRLPDLAPVLARSIMGRIR